MKVNSKVKVKGPPSQVLSRKEKRKAERKLKKARKDAFAHRKFEAIQSLKNIDTEYQLKSEEEKQTMVKTNKKKRKARNKRKKKEEKKQIKETEQKKIHEDEIELKQLERKLNLHKMKGKSKLPQSFMDDGLDYLLDATESEKIKGLEDITPAGPILGDSESDSEFEDDESISDEEVDRPIDAETDLKLTWNPDSKAGKSILKDQKHKNENKKVKFVDSQEDDFGDSEDESPISEDEEEEALSDDADMNDLDNEDESSKDVDNESEIIFSQPVKPSDNLNLNESPNKKRKRTDDDNELKEDIYGRLKDKEGNIVKSAYIPPAKRAMMAGNKPNEELNKRLKGLINKVSEGAMQFLSSQIESIYLEHSRAEVNETFASLVMEAVILPSLTPERLAAELAMLISILHSNVGSEVGAFFLQRLTVRFSELLEAPEYGIGKLMENLLNLLGNMYNFKIFNSLLIIDMMRKFIDKFGVRDIELLLVLFKTVGFTLRKEDPLQLKQIILEVQAKSRESDMTNVEGMEYRVKFMLDILTAIRNNNMRKIPGYDPTHLEHLKKVLKSFLRGQGLGDNILTISLGDLLKADQCGRWWIVGSAWDGRQAKDQSIKDNNDKTEIGELSGINKQMLKLAKQQGMNTDVRRHIFCILGTSEDYEDAFTRLIRLNLNRTQEREIIHVIYHCCLNEKTFNPFYAYLTEKFCTFDRRFTITVQFAMWDKFKEIDSMGKDMRSKLGSFLSHLLLSKALSLSVLKVVEFGMESKKMIRFLVHVLSEIISTPNMVTIKEIFERIAPFPKLKSLCQGLQVFMRVHLKGASIKGLDSIDLLERIEKVESAMFSTQSMVL